MFYTVLGNIPDSLENRLKRAASDTAKVMEYNRFARDLISGQNREYHQAQQIAHEGLMLAEHVHFDKGRAELLRTIGSAYYFLSDFEQSLKYYEQALNICEKMQDSNGMALNYYNIHLIYDAQSKIYYSLDVLQKAMSIWRQLGNTNYEIIASRSIIQLYQDIGDLQLAKVYAEEALQLAIETGNRRQQALLFDMLATIHILIGGSKEVAEDYFQKSLQIYEELNDQLAVARITHNIASEIYLNDMEMAATLLRKSANIYEKLSPTHHHLFEIYNSFANMFQAINQDDSTKYFKKKALNKAILSENAQTIANAYDTTAMFYLQKGNINLAENYFNKAFEIAVKTELYSVQSSSLWGLSTVSYRKGDYKTAFEHLRKYQVMNDSLSREENKKNVQKLTMQYEFEKDMTEKNEAIKAQLERQQQAIKYQQIIVTIISIALLCTAILLVFVIRSHNRNRQANMKLEQQHREILHINSELQKSHCELSRYKDNLEKMVEEQTEKLQQSEMQLRTLSDNLPGGCIYRKYVFPNGKEIITYISNTAEEWLGINAETIMDDINRFYRQMAPEDLEKKRQLEQESIRSMSPYSCEYRLMKGDREVWLLENAMPHADENQSIVWDTIVVDITDYKKFEKDLIEAKEHAEKSDKLKSAFLANMSHEIRTPMNGIVGFLNFIEREDLPAEKRHAYTGIIRGNVQQLLQLIGDIVDISKMDSQQLSLHRITFDLNKLLNELEIFFQDFILKHDKNLELLLDRSEFISPCTIESDPVRLKQVVSNLIGNAVKFTEKGYVRFGYKLTENRDQLYFFVEDTGIGIPESKKEYIFERFRQAHDGKTQILYGGTGLGLAISKNLVEMMGGKINVDSEEGVGSSFYFTLPYR